MNRDEAVRLLEDTFSRDFNIDRFARFVKELFNKIDVKYKDCTKYIAREYQEFLSEVIKIGEYEDAKKRHIEVLVVKLKRTSSRDRARTMQRNFVAKWLGNYDKDAALVAFYGDDLSDWRFSFVKMEYSLTKTEDGKVRVATELTPAKRCSFLVGKNEPNHTAKKQLVDLLMEEQAFPTLEDLEEAFNVEKVTQEFFDEYKERYLELRDELEKIVSKNEDVRREFEEKCIDVVDFSKRLLGQIVFIYFVQKKGWLGVGKDPVTGKFKKWGEGPKDFLRQLFDKKIVEYKNFFNDVLEPLFYEALARPRLDEDAFFSKFNCKIPFLNGGLFEPINGYSWHSVDILIDDNVFKKILGTFDTYNFTVKEDEPLDKEVAIDPEMLGKVFENLLEVKDRKSKGAFYTPREIVHYMCQQSLINYLETNTNIDRKDIERFLYLSGFSISSKENLPKSIEQNYRKIDDLLRDVKVVDPAVGSGAFPVGMMNEIVKMRNTLTPFFNEDEQQIRTTYNLKREAIENSLYGVDIEPSAVDIAQLRFWLSLIVDEESIDNIRPLPNLDHKIMCGNSLLEEFEGKKLFDERLLQKPSEEKPVELERIEREKNRLYKEFHDIHTGKKQNNGRAKEIEKELKKLERMKKEILSGSRENLPQLSLHSDFNRRIIESQQKLKKLKEFQSEYFNEQNRERKKQLADQIDRIEWEFIEETLKEQNSKEALEKLSQYIKYKFKPFFLWKLYFAEIFQRDNPGFDIVIANPPYVSYGLRDVGKLSKEEKEVIKRIFPNSAEYKISLYALFMDKSINLSRMNGVQSLIVPDSFLLGRYFSKIRKYILKNNRIDSILLFTNKVFDATVGFSVVYVFQRCSGKDNKLFCSLIEHDSDLINKRGYCYSQSYFTTTPYNRFRLFFNEKTMQLVKHIEQNSEILGKYLTGHTGVRSLIGQKKIVSKNCNGPTWKKGLISGSQIGRYWLKYEGDYLNIDPNLLNKGGWDENVILNKKIMVRQTGDQIYATIDHEKYYHLNNIHSFNKKNDQLALEYILAILNSSMLNAYYQLVTLEKGRTMAQTDIETLELLPIKEISHNQQAPLIQLVNQILAITKDDDYLDNPQKQARVKELEKIIDKLVYKLYELTEDEIKIVEEINEDNNGM